MKTCKVCGKPATAYVVDVVGGIPREYYLCNGCAANMNIVPQHFQMESIFKDLLNSLNHLPQSFHAPIEDVKCGNCGMTWSEFKRTMRFGCAHDYDLFNAASILDQIHGTHQHVGKTPKMKSPNEVTKSTLEEKVDLNLPVPKPDNTKIRIELQAKLDTAVKAEDYETAAKLRDQIKALAKSE